MNRRVSLLFPYQRRYFTTVRHGEEDPDITGVKHHYQLNDICEFFYCTRREPGSV